MIDYIKKISGNYEREGIIVAPTTALSNQADEIKNTPVVFKNTIIVNYRLQFEEYIVMTKNKNIDIYISIYNSLCMANKCDFLI